MRLDFDIADEVGAGASLVAFGGGAFSVLVGDVHQEANIARLAHLLHDQVRHEDLIMGRKDVMMSLMSVLVDIRETL